MPKRKTKSSSGGRAIATLMLVAALGVGALYAYVKFTPAAQHVAVADRRTTDSEDAPTPRRHSRESDTDGPDVSVKSSPDLKLRVPSVDGLNVKLGKSAGRVPDGIKPMVFISNATLKELNLDKARALGVDIKNRNALVDFNEDIESGFGSMEEGMVIKALQTALGQFPEIDTFQFVVGGKALTTLGQADLTDPIPVIRAATPTSSDAGSTKVGATEGGPGGASEKAPTSDEHGSGAPSKPSEDPKAPPED